MRLDQVKGITVYPEGIKVGRNHILFNPVKKVSETYIGTNLWFGEQRFHFFYNELDALREANDLIVMMREYSERYNRIHLKYTKKQPLRITIHIPKKLKDLISLIEEDLMDIDLGDFVRLNVSTEKKGVTFSVPGATFPEDYPIGKMEWHLHVRFNGPTITASVSCTEVYPLYDHTPYYFQYGTAFENQAQRFKPEMFKDQIIENFKKACPNGILKSFKSDEDIWNYIMMNNDWKVSEEDIK